MTNTIHHGSEVRDGATYCTDCGRRLEVGGLESLKHTDPVTHARGACPNAAKLVRARAGYFVEAGGMGVDAGQAIFGPVSRAMAESFIKGLIYGANPMTAKQQQLIDAVKAHAQAHYEEDGWDFIVETYDDEELAEELKGCRSEASAITRMRRLARLHDERRSSTGFDY